MRNPITGIAGCCARAASGHAAAAPPSSVMSRAVSSDRIAFDPTIRGRMQDIELARISQRVPERLQPVSRWLERPMSGSGQSRLSKNDLVCDVAKLTRIGDWTGGVPPRTAQGMTGGLEARGAISLMSHKTAATVVHTIGNPNRQEHPASIGSNHQGTIVLEIDLSPRLIMARVRVATGTMGYKHRSADRDAVRASLATPNFLLKIILHVDGTARICEARPLIA